MEPPEQLHFRFENPPHLEEVGAPLKLESHEGRRKLVTDAEVILLFRLVSR
jgi:hypothetical protein